MTLYDLIDVALKTYQVRADGTTAPILALSRRGPMRSAVKRYALWLGLDPHTASPDAYHRPDHEIRMLMATKAPAHLAERTTRNLVNDVIALFRLAVDQGWLEPLPSPLHSWRTRRPYPSSFVKRAEQGVTPPYRLEPKDCPPAFLDDLRAYVAWCEAPVARNRDRRIIKKPVTSQKTYKHMLRLAGFAVRELGYAPESISIRALCQPELIEAFINWWLTVRRGKVTASLEQYLIIPRTLARHWLQDAELTATLGQMMKTLPLTEPVRDKSTRWLSLRQLDEIGESLHPLNARRLHDFPILKQPYYAHMHSQRYMAHTAEFGLIIRLLVRLPMRQRCIREMLWGTNLYQDHAGVWQIRFVGAQLKIAVVKGVISEYTFPFPADLVPVLEDWLNVWRPKLCVGTEEKHVFLKTTGAPFTVGKEISDPIARHTWRFSGVGVTPHMIRDIWASEYLDAHPGDVGGCARRLGNRPETVMAHYAHILKRSADGRAEQFLQATLAR